MRRIHLAAALAALTVLALTACGLGTPTPSDTPTPETTASGTPTPTPTPTPDPEPVAATCENIVSPATIAGFAASGVSITPAEEFHAKLVSEGNALAAIFDAGGVVCQTGAGAGAYEIYAYAVMSIAQFDPLRVQFLADGMIEEDTDAGVLYHVPNDMEGLPRICYFRPDAYLVCGNVGERLDEIVTTLGL